MSRMRGIVGSDGSDGRSGVTWGSGHSDVSRRLVEESHAAGAEDSRAARDPGEVVGRVVVLVGERRQPEPGEEGQAAHDRQ